MVENFERKVSISPSTLSLTLDELTIKIKEIEDLIEYIHIDVMDGKFVSNKTNGVEMFKVAKENSNKQLDVHLMVEKPLEEIEKYNGAEIITFHVEVFENQADVLKAFKMIRNMNAKVGISIKPNTSVDILKDILDEIDMILVMTVEPGLGGQKLLVETLDKVIQLRRIGFDKLIEVDGGIKIENASIVRNAGVDIIVAGTAVFSAENPREVIRKIKGID